ESHGIHPCKPPAAALRARCARVGVAVEVVGLHCVLTFQLAPPQALVQAQRDVPRGALQRGGAPGNVVTEAADVEIPLVGEPLKLVTLSAMTVVTGCKIDSVGKVRLVGAGFDVADAVVAGTVKGVDDMRTPGGNPQLARGR